MHFFFQYLVIGSSIERFAVEIRHLQRTEILEVEEKIIQTKRIISNASQKKPCSK